MIYYVIAVSLFRGFVFPDFRYGDISMVAIQLAYPALLSLPVLIGKGVQLGYWRYFLLGIGGIVLSEIVAVSMYARWAGLKNLEDGLTQSIFLASFIAMIVLFAMMLGLAFAFNHWNRSRFRP